MKVNVVCSPCFRDVSVLDSVSTVISSCFRDVGLEIHLSVSHIDAAPYDSRGRMFKLDILDIEIHESEALIKNWAELLPLLANFLNASARNIILTSKYAVI